MATIATAQSFCIGDQVAFEFGGRPARGHIVEAQGPFRRGGENYFRVRLDMDPYEPMFLSLPQSKLERSHEIEAPLTKQEIRKYLVDGGLLLILGSYREGNASRVWLRRDNLGNVTHTFNESSGLVGGNVPPAFAAQFGRILWEKEKQVVEFVASFGFNDAEAREIVKEVGVRS